MLPFFLKISVRVDARAHREEEHDLNKYIDRWVCVNVINEITTWEKKEEVEKDKFTYTPIGSIIYTRHLDIADHEFYFTKETPDSLVARINNRIAEDRALHHPKEESKEIVAWEPGKLYQRLDVVYHPDNADKTYICVKQSQSDSALVLKKMAYWCDISEPDEDV